MTNLLRSALTSFSNQQKQNTMDHSNVLNIWHKKELPKSQLYHSTGYFNMASNAPRFFWKNSDHTFFELGNYCGQRKKNTKQPLDDLHMIDGLGDETKITSIVMFCPNRDDDLVKKVCPSLLKWANYLFEPYEDIENKD
jgi:hypothetical protein